MLGGGQWLPSMEAKEGWIFKKKIIKVNADDTQAKENEGEI